jgi:hypothetical protein
MPQNNALNGGKAHKKYNGREYVVRKGSRGGKYIVVKGYNCKISLYPKLLFFYLIN